MEKIKVLKHNKEDLKNLEKYLLQNNLIDNRKLWFAGFPFIDGTSQNAIAGNLFYGNKRLKIVCIKDETVYYIHNKKTEFSVYEMGTVTSEKYIRVRKKVLYPIVELQFDNDKLITLQIKQNKGILNDFKKVLK